MRISNPVLHAGVDGDEVASIAKQERVFVRRMFDGPENILGASFFLPLVSNAHHLSASNRQTRHAIERPGQVDMKSWRQGSAAQRLAEAFDETLFFDAYDGHRGAEPPQKGQTNDEWFDTSPNDLERPGRSQVDAELALSGIEQAAEDVRPAAEHRQCAEVQRASVRRAVFSPLVRQQPVTNGKIDRNHGEIDDADSWVQAQPLEDRRESRARHHPPGDTART